MNLALRKLAMLEQCMIKKEEEAKISGYTTSPSDLELRKNITRLMEQVRVI